MSINTQCLSVMSVMGPWSLSAQSNSAPYGLKWTTLKTPCFFQIEKENSFINHVYFSFKGFFYVEFERVIATRKKQNNTQHLCRQFYYNLISFYLTFSPLFFSVKPDYNP